MRTSSVAVLLLASGLLAPAAKQEEAVTVVLRLGKARHSETALGAMKTEALRIFDRAGVRLHWARPSDAASRSDFSELVVFQVRGTCAMDRLPVVTDELGVALAITHSADGHLLSFGEVDCDRVRNSTKRTMTSADFRRGDEVLGRALGRVLAHELYHILARSAEHDVEGITKASLSPGELTADQLSFSEGSMTAIRRQLGLLAETESSAGRRGRDGAKEREPMLP